MNYIRTLLTTAIFTLAIAAGFNWFIDPYGMYWSPIFEGVNQKKTEAGNRGRTNKPYILASLKPENIIIGNSRVEMGIDPEHKLFDRPTFNYGLPGLKLYAQIDNAINEIEVNKNLKQIFLSLDYVDFLHPPEILSAPYSDLNWRSPSKSFNASKGNYIAHSKILFSLETLHSSFITLFKQNTMSSSITRYGFNTAESFISITSTEGKKPLFENKLIGLKQKLAQKNLRHRSKNWSTLGTNFDELQGLFEKAKLNGITISIFTNPYHSSYLHLLDDLGYWADYQEWKHNLILFLQQNNSHTLRAAIDFSGFNHITMEPVNLEKPYQKMKWFWEPAHYNKSLGNLLLPIILGNEKIDGIIAKDLKVVDPLHVREEDNIGLMKSKNEWVKLKEHLNLAL